MIRRLPIPMSLLDPQVEDVRTPFDYSAPSLNAKRDWRASLFDRLIPQGDATMSDADKTRATRQGLLQLAIGLQSSNNFGESLAKGLSGGLLSMNQGVDDLQNRQYKQQLLASRTGDPTEFRALDMQARAAGYEPGTPGYQHFMRVQAGLEAKKSNAAIAYKPGVDKDGHPIMVAYDPNTVGAEIVGTGDTYGPGVDNRAAPPADLPAPTTGAGGALLQGAGIDPQIGKAITAAATKYGIPPAELLAVAQQESSLNPRALNKSTGAAGLFQFTPGTAQQYGIDPYNVEQAADAAAKQWAERRKVGGVAEAAASHFAGPGGGNRGPKTAQYVQDVTRRVAQLGGNPFVGQSPAEKAAAEAQAKAQVEMQYAPRIEAAKTGASIDATNARAGASAATAGAIEGAKTTAQKAAERQQEGVGNLPTAEANADQMLALINKAIKHPGRAAATGLSSWNPLNKIPGTDARDFSVLQDQIKGRTFLEAFNSLKGGGQITENEGKKAEAAIARLDTSQSETEYLQALRDLQGVVNNARMRARSKAGARPTMPKRDQFAGFKVLD